MKTIAIAVLAVAALAQQAPPLNPEVLQWQAEAQARERAINRKAELQLSRAPRTPAPVRHPGAKPKPGRRGVPK